MRKYFYSLATDQIHTPLAQFLKAVLFLLSLLYGVLVKTVLWGCKKNIFIIRNLPWPVISVGNITWGGTGKTPLVIWLARHLRQEGLKVAVLTRGYMPSKNVSNQKDAFSDEVAVLESMLADVPVIKGSDRFAAARKALEKYPVDVFILDDGFQHWRLHRDLDIVAIDATQPFGNRRLIPRGILREPVRNLKRADIFVVTKSDLGKNNLSGIRKELNVLSPGCAIVESIHAPVCLVDVKSDAEKGLDFLRGKEICSFCSIGDPASFERMLCDLGAHIQRQFAFTDHHSYNAADIRIITDFCRRQNIDTLVTTHKDAVKLKSLSGEFSSLKNILYLKIKTQITQGQDDFTRRIHALFSR